MRAALAISIGVAACTGATLAHAQQPPVAGRPANLAPSTPSDLALKTQTVEFSFLPDREAWAVRARYEVSNPQSRPASETLELAELGCAAASDFEACDPAKVGFDTLDAVVDGRKVALRRRTAPPSQEGGEPQQVWTLPLRVAAGATVSIEQQYVVPAGPSEDGGYDARFVMRDTAHWARPIGRATFKLGFPAYSCLVVEPEHLPRKSRRVVMHGETPWVELVYETYVWTAPSDVELYFEPCVVPRDTELQGCPALSELIRYFYPPEGTEDGAPITKQALLSKLAGLRDQELAKCRDTVFDAYAGYYQPSELAQLPKLPETDRHYTAALLTPADWAWVHMLDAQIAQRERARTAQRKAHAEPAANGGGCGCSTLGGSPRFPHSGAMLLLCWLAARRRQRTAGRGRGRPGPRAPISLKRR